MIKKRFTTIIKGVAKWGSWFAVGVYKGVVKWGSWFGRGVFYIFFVVWVMLFPLAFLQLTMSRHWAWGLPLTVVFVFGVYFGIRELRRRQVETQQGIQAIAIILLLTICVFSFLSFVLYRFGYAHYEGFRTQALNENWSITFNFVGFYTWQLFDVIPALRVNEALGWNSPLLKSGFGSGVLALGFRATVILVLLKEFRAWWAKRGQAALIDSQKRRSPSSRRHDHFGVRRQRRRFGFKAV